MHADAAVPEFWFGILRAVTFWHELPSDTGTVWRHLERHEPGRVLHGLYQGDRDRLGVRVPLTEHPDVARLAGSLGPAVGAVETGLPDALTAAYVPNMRPNRQHRGSPLGHSDYQGLHDLFDALDTTWTSWMRDIRLARARLIVPDSHLQSNGPGNGASFDQDREIWQQLNAESPAPLDPTVQHTTLALPEPCLPWHRTPDGAPRGIPVSTGHTEAVSEQCADALRGRAVGPSTPRARSTNRRAPYSNTAPPRPGETPHQQHRPLVKARERIVA